MTVYEERPRRVEAIRFEKPWKRITEFSPRIQLIKEYGSNAIESAKMPYGSGELRSFAYPGDWIVKWGPIYDQKFTVFTDEEFQDRFNPA